MRRRYLKPYRAGAHGKFTISVPAETHAALKALAESQNKSMRQVVEEWVDDATLTSDHDGCEASRV